MSNIEIRMSSFLRFTTAASMAIGVLTGYGCGSRESSNPYAAEAHKEISRYFGPNCTTSMQSGIIQVKDKSGTVAGYVLLPDAAAEVGAGFRGPVPVMILCDAQGMIRQVSLLPNTEDKPFMAKVMETGMLDEWSRFSLDEAADLPVDTVTGATYSSQAIITSVRGLIMQHQNSLSGAIAP